MHRAVLAGDVTTGVTIMQVVRELDAGDMLATVELPIGPDETSESLETRLAASGAELLIRVLDELPRYLDARVPQQPSLATYATRLEKHEGEIDWTRSASDIHNRVRGLTPWPLAHTFVHATRLVVRRTRLLLDSHTTHMPGTITAIEPDGLTVACGHGSSLSIIEVQPEGRRTMAIRDYLSGHPLSAGQRLGRHH